jgi:hypothetical protein
MQNKIAPKTVLGEWSIGLNAFFLLVIIISIVLVEVLGVLSFDNHWWDVTVLILFLATIIALFTGIISVRKSNENSILVYISIFISICAILFVMFHSLIISD